jgi:S1-C subfamily serine protease
MLIDFSNQIADAVAAAAPSVVQVHGRRRPASGIVYADGVIVTTMRVVGGEDGAQVRQQDGKVADAELAGWDPATSLAVLRAGGLTAPPLAPSSAPVRVGHFAVALARSWSNSITASAGVIAVIGGPLQTGRRRAIDHVFRTTAPMHDGFAGGAFLDAAGGLIGLTTAASIRGLTVVIPASIVWNAAATIREHGRVKRGYVGIAGQPVTLTDRQRAATGRERGLVVLAVTNGGPAQQAGVLVGDVLLAFDGTSIESPEELIDLLLATGAGHTAKVGALRGDVPVELTVTAGERVSR